jgi:glyoxylase-like metal-dependent hydrolase (beta-lactamase superfamily II)
MPSGVAEVVAPDAELVSGVVVETDLGPWHVYETPGHAPSHVCLFQPERRLLISGDHLLGRISLYYDYGWTPDPIAEFLSSLDVVEGLDARLCMSGHGRTFTDVGAHIEGNRALVAERLEATLGGLTSGPLSALEVVPAIFGERLTEATANWRLTETLCYLHHLEAIGRVVREDGDRGVELWRARPGEH